MNFIFAKLFEEYLRKNDPAKFNITLYISVFYFFLCFIFLLPLKTFINNKYYNDRLDHESSSSYVVVFGLFFIILLVVYYIYIKKKLIFRLVEKYKAKNINQGFLYLMIVLIPTLLLLLAGAVTVLLNGGKILGVEINGLRG